MPIEVNIFFLSVSKGYRIQVSLWAFNIEALFHKNVDKINNVPVV